MPRKGEVPKRDILPDPKYKSKLVAKFVNCMMKDGKKGVSESIMYKAFVLSPITLDVSITNPASSIIDPRSAAEKECVWAGGFPQDLTNRSPILIFSQSFIP